MITIVWIDESGAEVTSRCFSEYHAMMLEETLDASGLHHSRAAKKEKGK